MPQKLYAVIVSHDPLYKVSDGAERNSNGRVVSTKYCSRHFIPRRGWSDGWIPTFLHTLKHHIKFCHQCTANMRHDTINEGMDGHILGSLNTCVFETRTATGSELISILTSPHTTTFTLLSIFFSSRKIWETLLSKHAKCSLPVAVCVIKTHVLKLPIVQWKGSSGFHHSRCALQEMKDLKWASICWVDCSWLKMANMQGWEWRSGKRTSHPAGRNFSLQIWINNRGVWRWTAC